VKKVFNYFLELFNINEDVLNESIKYSNLKYNYTKFMNVNFARKIIEKTAMKIELIPKLNDSEMIIYRLQEINGLMTWSKNILTNKTKKFRRYDSTNNILYVLLKQKYLINSGLSEKLVPKTISGSEKQGMLFFLLNHIKSNDQNLFNRIKMKAESYYKFSKL
jgi:hypothetical protein